MSRENRGQIAIFAILAVLVVLMIAGFFVLQSVADARRAARNNVGQVQDSEVALKAYVKSCIDQEISPLIYLISRQAGRIDLNFPTQKFGQQVFAYGFNVVAQDPVLLPTKAQMESELSRKLTPGFKECINNFDSFKQNNMDVKVLSEPKPKVTIALDQVMVKVDYPVEINSRSGKVSIKEFDSEVWANLGELHMQAQKIVDKSASNPKDVDSALRLAGQSVDIGVWHSCKSTIFVSLANDKKQSPEFDDPLFFNMGLLFFENNRPDSLVTKCQ